MEKDIKIAIINDEKIDYIYIGKEDVGHALLLRNYIKNKYPQVNTNNEIDFDNANSMGLYLREKGNVVFFNDTVYKNGNPDKHGKTGIVIIPDEITEEKKELVKEFNKKLVNYDGLQVWYDFESHIECKMIFTKTKEQVKTIVGYVLDKYGKTK